LALLQKRGARRGENRAAVKWWGFNGRVVRVMRSTRDYGGFTIPKKRGGEQRNHSFPIGESKKEFSSRRQIGGGSGCILSLQRINRANPIDATKG